MPKGTKSKALRHTTSNREREHTTSQARDGSNLWAREVIGLSGADPPLAEVPMGLLFFLLLLAASLFAQNEGARGRHAPLKKTPAVELSDDSITARAMRKPTRVHFTLWETRQHLRRRTGAPLEYYVPAVDKMIGPAKLDYYQTAYKTVYDVFYRDTPLGLVRVLVSYVKDDSRSHLAPELRVGHVFFIFDKDVQLREALNTIYEAQALCAEGCMMNGFAASVIAEPRQLSQEQALLARRMRPQWHGVEMPDAAPGLQVFYQDSLYPIDFEHSFVERLDLTLVSNAGQERYSIEVRGKEPTMLNVWRPRRHPSETMASQ